MGSIKTTSSRTAAVLMSLGFPLVGTDANRRLIAFEVEIPDSKMSSAEDVVKKCLGEAMDMHVHLGRYEAAWRSLRPIIWAHQGRSKRGKSP